MGFARVLNKETVIVVIVLSVLIVPLSCPFYQFLFGDPETAAAPNCNFTPAGALPHDSDSDSNLNPNLNPNLNLNLNPPSATVRPAPTAGLSKPETVEDLSSKKVILEGKDAQDLLKPLPHEPLKNNGLLFFDRLPLRKRGFIAKQVSSYDWSGDNQDFNHFISIKDDKFRIFEDYGPGCILRAYFIFSSGSNREIGVLWNVLVEVDGALVFNRTLREMSTGAHHPYVFPLSGLNEIRHGYFNYIPIFYKKSCIITIDAHGYKFPPKKDPMTFFGQALYHSITYHKYNFLPSPSDPETFKGDFEDVEPILRKLHQSYYGIVPSRLSSLPVNQVYEKTNFPLVKGSNTLMLHKGAGAIIGFYIHLKSNKPKHFLSVGLKGFWDGSKTPQINSTIGLFFSSETGDYTSRSYAVGYRPDMGGYCHFPMPFWNSAEITIVNPFEKTLSVDFKFEITHTQYPKEETGYFHATWHGEDPYARGKDFPMFVDNERWGHVVGIFLNTRRFLERRDGFPFEGDERFYIDGSKTAVIHGTGTEDYFNTGHLFDRMHNFSMPFHGNPYYWKLSSEKYDLHAYRLHIQDFIPYHSSIIMGMETSPSIYGSSAGSYVSLGLHYSGNQPGMVLSDEIDIGDSTSEQKHSYVCTNCDITPPLTNSYDGINAIGPKITDTGRHVSGKISFTVALNPSNTGVLLRRRIDHKHQNQKGKVSVDKKEVGIWFEMKRNPFFYFRDSEFWIPADYTKGKNSIKVEIDVVYQGSKEGESDYWTEFHYWIYCEV
eukprot:TRINITY_DN3726_c0_g1_i3.p1 TRINITY_DN3726_c0_g1~~TRINITY_DN3726_c0_g1_i3.p1  ORF type:complete len:771 (+),score=104.31 TRINITY_DN3726_c0_g1_i3:73-2385(+)